MDKDLFFAELAKRWPYQCKILVTGAWVAEEWGKVRPTQDIDFEIKFQDPKARLDAFQKAVDEASRASGLIAQFSTDIDR